MRSQRGSQQAMILTYSSAIPVFIRYLAGPLLIVVLVSAAGCLDPAIRAPVFDAGDNHPLAGKIWSSANTGFITIDQLMAAVARADYLLLGEVHDNERHHELQSRLLDSFPGEPQSVAVGFEQLDSSQAPSLGQYLEENPENAAGLGAALDWKASGWPDWSLYKPVFQQVLDRGWRPIPLMFPADKIKAITENGYRAVLEENALAILQPDTAIDPEQAAAAQALMRSAHCGKLPEEYLPAMVRIQTAKDAHMAWLQFRAGQPGILIIGDGHARKDRGIPLFLRKLAPEATVVVISMVEVEPGQAQPADYPQTRASYSDFVMFTKRQQREDPCANIVR